MLSGHSPSSTMRSRVTSSSFASPTKVHSARMALSRKCSPKVGEGWAASVVAVTANPMARIVLTSQVLILGTFGVTSTILACSPFFPDSSEQERP